MTASKRVDPKNLFGPQEALQDELIYGNATLNFSLFPFVIVQDGRVLFLSRPGENEVVFRDLAGGAESALDSEEVWRKIAEFQLANFCFADLERLEPQRLKCESGFWGKWREVEAAQRNQQLKLFTESLLQLEEIAFEDFNMPLIYLLQIRNLANLNRGLEMKRLLQKFLLFYPFYAEGHELMGDVYAREENIELALNFYEKALLISQSKNLGDKINKLRELHRQEQEQARSPEKRRFFRHHGNRRSRTRRASSAAARNCGR